MSVDGGRGDPAGEMGQDRHLMMSSRDDIVLIHRGDNGEVTAGPKVRWRS